MNTLKSAQIKKQQCTRRTQCTLFLIEKVRLFIIKMPEKCIQILKSASKCMIILINALFKVLTNN